jgi:hypothetical protein
MRDINVLAIGRLVKNITDSTGCGTRLATHTLPDGYRRPAMPETIIWYSHGLWERAVPTSDDLSCEYRFAPVVKPLDSGRAMIHPSRHWFGKRCCQIKAHSISSNSYI